MEQVKSGDRCHLSNCNVILVTFALSPEITFRFMTLRLISPPNSKSVVKDNIFRKLILHQITTLASLTSILTGRFGSSTGVTGWDKGLVKDIPTLPEILGYYGYETAGFTIDSASGFVLIMDLTEDFNICKSIVHLPRTPDGRDIFGEYVKGAAAIPAAKWLNKRLESPKASTEKDQKPFLLMFHSRTARFPFVIQNATEEEDPTGMRPYVI